MFVLFTIFLDHLCVQVNVSVVVLVTLVGDFQFAIPFQIFLHYRGIIEEVEECHSSICSVLNINFI